MSKKMTKLKHKQQEAVIICSDSLGFTDDSDVKPLLNDRQRRLRRGVMSFCHCMKMSPHTDKYIALPSTQLLPLDKAGGAQSPRYIDKSTEEKVRGPNTGYMCGKNDEKEHEESDEENEIPLVVGSMPDLFRAARTSFISRD